MDKRIIKRVLDESNYILNTGDTIRQIANIFGVSKSTVHKDLKERLLEIDSEMYNKVSNILKYHLEIRHIRGGNATKYKFLSKKVKI